MRNIKKHFLNNIVFYIIAVLALLVAFVNYNISYFGENPFALKYPLENPVQAAFADNYHYYVTDSSYTIASADRENCLAYVIKGGDAENTFDHADTIAAGSDGVLYVHDKSYRDDGNCAYRERILKFTGKGRNREILYEVQTADENGTQIIYLDSLRFMNDTLYFSEIDEDGIHVKRIDGDIAEDCAFMPLDGANDSVMDSTFSNDFDISAVLMNGDVYTCRNGENKLIYHAREFDTNEYFSLITEIAYGEDNILYANDTGQRRVLSITDDQISTVIEQNAFNEDKPEEFAMCPIYSGLNISGNTISLLTTEYKYDDTIGKQNYFYRIAVSDSNGNSLFYDNSLEVSIGRRITVFSIYAAIFLMVCIAGYFMIRIISIVRQNGIAQVRIQLIVLVTAIVVTFGVSFSVFQSSSKRFSDESAANLSNIAYLIDAKLDKDIVKDIGSPDMYFSDEYEILNESIMDVLKSDVNKNRNVYAVLYKVYNNVICEVYRNDSLHGIMYPMAGVYDGSVEEEIAEKQICYVSQDYELSEGNYTLSLIPSYDTDGEVIAFIEVGTDYNYFVQENDRLFKKLLLTAAMAVIIIMLMFSELMNGASVFCERKISLAKKTDNDPEIIRPIAFLIFFTANITTAFLPIYGTSLWNESFPLPSELAAAFPLSAELILSALSALLSGSLIKKTGVRPMCISGALFYVTGNLLSAFAENLWVLICANSICGIGGGMLTIAVNTWITGLGDEQKQNKGFVHYNAAFLAGMNCGTVIGSMIWENFGVKSAYMTAAVCAVLIVICTLLLIEKRKLAASEKYEKEKFYLRNFLTLDMMRYFICLAVPYLICASFLSYYFPIVAERNQLSATEISVAFLISGLISIYAGSAIGEVVTNHLGVRKVMILASFIYAAALLYLVISPSIASCYVVIVMFATADSFGLSAQSVYFVSMPEVKKIGQSRALGINSTIESITSAFGSVIFGAALLLGERRGIFLIAAIFSALLLLFIIGGRRNAKLDTSGNE